MTYLIGVPLLALAAAVQATVLSRLHLAGGGVDLVLILVLSWTLAGEPTEVPRADARGWQGGIIWALIGGLLLDLLSGGPFGISALALILVAYLASLSEGRFWRSHVLLPLGTVLTATLVFHAVTLIILAAVGYPLDWSKGLLTIVLPATLLNTLVMLPVYHLMRWLHAFVYPVPVHL